jgi:hypothetical protein
MNLNREQFLKAVERGQTLLKELKKDYPELKLTPVFSRFGPGSGQCDLTVNLRHILLDFPEMLAVTDDTKRLRSLMFDLQKAEQEKKAEREKAEELVSKLRKQCDALEAKLLIPDLLLYCDDVLIEYRPENLKYESLRRLQQDSRLPPGLNTVGNIRVIAGSLDFLAGERS